MLKREKVRRANIARLEASSPSMRCPAPAALPHGRSTLLEVNSRTTPGAAEWEPLRCLIPGFDGAVFSREWKDGLWARCCMGAPRRLGSFVGRFRPAWRAWGRCRGATASTRRRGGDRRVPSPRCCRWMTVSTRFSRRSRSSRGLLRIAAFSAMASRACQMSPATSPRGSGSGDILSVISISIRPKSARPSAS